MRAKLTSETEFYLDFKPLTFGQWIKKTLYFKVYCPGQYKHFPFKLMMYNNGSVTNNVKYQNLCVESFAINLAYNHDPWVFEVENNSVVDLREKYEYYHGEYVGSESSIAEDDEILSKFFLNYNILIREGFI